MHNPAMNRRDTIHPDPNAMRVINSRGFQPTARVGAIYGLAGAKLLGYIYYIRYRDRLIRNKLTTLIAKHCQLVFLNRY